METYLERIKRYEAEFEKTMQEIQRHINVAIKNKNMGYYTVTDTGSSKRPFSLKRNKRLPRKLKKKIKKCQTNIYQSIQKQ